MLLQRHQHHQPASRRRGAATTTTPTTKAAPARRRPPPPRVVVAASSSSPAAAAVAEQTKPAPSVVVRPYAGESELWAVARLRAEAYHEDDSSRFAGTFKKQFAEREAASLRQRTAGGGGGGSTGAPRCECLVAVAAAAASSSQEDGDSTSPQEQEVLGCIDLRPPPHGAAPPGAPSSSGVPPEDAARGAYLLNVVVSERARGKGVGEALMRAAMRRARREHGALRAYTHVEAGNGPAARLYARCGFAESGEERGALAGALDLGRVLLLRADFDGEGEEVDGA